MRSRTSWRGSSRGWPPRSESGHTRPKQGHLRPLGSSFQSSAGGPAEAKSSSWTSRSWRFTHGGCGSSKGQTEEQRQRAHLQSGQNVGQRQAAVVAAVPRMHRLENVRQLQEVQTDNGGGQDRELQRRRSRRRRRVLERQLEVSLPPKNQITV